MPRTDASNIALSALRSAKQGIDINASNRASLNNPNAVSQQVVSSLDKFGCVRTQVLELCNEHHLNESRKALTSEVDLSTRLELLKKIETAIGKKNDGTSFLHRGVELSGSFAALASSSDDNFGDCKHKAYSDLTLFLDSMKTLSSTIKETKQSAENGIGNNIKNINQFLSDIASYNLSAKMENILNNDHTASQGQRTAINEIAKHIGLYTQTQQDGTLRVFTDMSGQCMLVDGGEAAQLNYNPSSTVDSKTTFSPITITFKGLTLETISKSGTSITNDFTDHLSKLSGAISSNLYIRDTLTGSLNSQINKLAGNFFSTVNDIHNQATSTVIRNQIIGEGIPGHSSLNGAETIDGANTNGIVRFALMDSSLKSPVTTGSRNYLDVDFSEFNPSSFTKDVNGLINFLNSKFSAASPNGIGIQASLTNGQLSLKANNNSYGIVIGEISESTIQGAFGSSFFSSFFGLNNLLSSTSSPSDSDFLNGVSIRSDIKNSRGEGLAIGLLTLDSNATGYNASRKSILDKKVFAEDLSDCWSNTQITFGATDTLSGRTTSLEEYATAIIANHETMTKTIIESHDLAVTKQKRAAEQASRSCKVDPESLESDLAKIMEYKKSNTTILSAERSFIDDINSLLRR